MKTQQISNEKPNVLLIVLDTARADVVSEMMSEGQLKNISNLADNATKYESAFTTSPWTLPSHASIFSGMRAYDHGVHYGSPEFNIPSKSMASALQNQGYKTLGISGNPWISPDVGFDKGFDKLSMKWDLFWNADDLSSAFGEDSWSGKIEKLYDSITLSRAPKTLINTLFAKTLAGRSDKGGKLTTKRTKRWFEKKGMDEMPFFYFINYLEPHLEYSPPKKYVEKFVGDESVLKEIDQDPWKYLFGESDLSKEELNYMFDLYRAELSYCDDLFGELVSSLKNRDVFENTMIIVVGDHGENIGDHDLLDHQYSVHNTLMKVPLMIKYPNESADYSVDELVEIRDLYPTVLTAGGAEVPTRQGISQQTLQDENYRTNIFAAYLSPPDRNLNIGNRSEMSSVQNFIKRRYRTIITDEYKLIESSDGRKQLYDMKSDPQEQTNLYNKECRISTNLSEQLDQEGVPIEKSTQESFELSSQNQSHLEDLGYL